MHRHNKKTNLHWYDEKRLEQLEKQRDNMTEKWLKENGLKPATFHTLPLEQVQADSIAHHLLNDCQHLLSKAQEETLTQYSKAIHNKRLRKAITKAQTYRVLNIGKKVNRKLFRQYRQQQAKSR